MTARARPIRIVARLQILFALAARAFLTHTLPQRGRTVLAATEMAEAVVPLTELERDALAELSNVAMARAATSLRQMVQAEVVLSVPSVEIMSPEDAVRAVAKPGSSNLVAVRQDFSGPFSGRALLIFTEATSLELVRAVAGQHLPLEDIVDLEDEALAKTGNIILNSWVATLANLLKQKLTMSLPTVIRRDQRHIFESPGLSNAVILFLHIRFEIRDQQIGGYVALMMDVPSIDELRTLISEFVDTVVRPPTRDR